MKTQEALDKPMKHTPKLDPKPREIRLPHNSYQPSAAELRADLRLKGTFEDAIKALVRPVQVPRKRKS